MVKPGVAVLGSEYPLPPATALLCSVLSILRYGVFVLPLLLSRIPFVRTHPWYPKFQQNQMMILIGIYFAVGMFISSVSSTGAFEIYFNDRLIFSKLAAGRMPELGEVIEQLP